MASQGRNGLVAEDETRINWESRDVVHFIILVWFEIWLLAVASTANTKSETNNLNPFVES